MARHTTTRTEQDQQLRCKNCYRTRNEHKYRQGSAGSCNTLHTFRYDPQQAQNFRARCMDCGQTGQAHVGASLGCLNFVPEPWDERRCLRCKHHAFLHKGSGCLGDSARCTCNVFTPTGQDAAAPVITLIERGDDLECPRCGSNTANQYAVEGLEGYIDACGYCAHASALDALAGVAPTSGGPAPTAGHGRYAPPVSARPDPHANCPYAGTCVAHYLNPSVPRCMGHVGPQG